MCLELPVPGITVQFLIWLDPGPVRLQQPPDASLRKGRFFVGIENLFPVREVLRVKRRVPTAVLVDKRVEVRV